MTQPPYRNENVIRKPLKPKANNQSKQKSTMTDFFQIRKQPNATVPSENDSCKKDFNGENRIEKNGNAIDNPVTAPTILRQDSMALYDFTYDATQTQSKQRTAHLIEKPKLKPIRSQNTSSTQIRAKIQAQKALNQSNNGFVTAQSIFKPKINSEQTNGNQQNGKQNFEPKKISRLGGSSFYDIENLFEDRNKDIEVNKNRAGPLKSIVNVVPESNIQGNNTISDILGIKCKSIADHVIQNDFDDESDESAEEVSDSLRCDENAFLAIEEHTTLCDEIYEKSPEERQSTIKPTNENARLSTDIIETNADNRYNNNQMSDEIGTHIKMMKPLKHSIGKGFLSSYAYKAPPRLQHSSQPFESPQLERKKPRPTIDEMIIRGEQSFDGGISTIRTMPNSKQRYTHLDIDHIYT